MRILSIGVLAQVVAAYDIRLPFRRYWRYTSSLRGRPMAKNKARLAPLLEAAVSVERLIGSPALRYTIDYFQLYLNEGCICDFRSSCPY